MDIEKLIKVLGMTGSTHDGEALAALRTAQRMMAAGKVTWADLLKKPAAAPYVPSTWPPTGPVKKPPQQPKPSDKSYYQNDPDIDAYAEAMKAQMRQEEMLRKYYADQRAKAQANANRNPNFGDDLFEAVFGHKRKR